MTVRDHLFINYATEDGVFAEWLTLKLIAEGYRVWCDRVKLLGGESYPRDIDRAIKHNTFRMLSVLSESSVEKENPVKERTLALNIARERQEDFLIPLKLDGLAPHKLPWMTADLTYIPFNGSWAQGLEQLLKKLRSINAPCTLEEGRKILASWVEKKQEAVEREETLWSNILPIQEVPDQILRISAGTKLRKYFEDWPYYRENDYSFWSLEVPSDLARKHPLKIKEFNWRVTKRTGMNPKRIMTFLLSRYLYLHCIQKGMILHRAGKTRKQLLFTSNCADGDWLPYKMRSGRKSRIRVIGKRTFRAGFNREQSKYQLAPSFRPILDLYDMPVFLINLHIHLRSEGGAALPDKVAFRRQRKIRRTWWNGAWLARLLAVCQWITDGEESINLARTESCQIVIQGDPLFAKVPVGIDEDQLAPAPDFDESEEIDENDEQDTEDEEASEND